MGGGIKDTSIASGALTVIFCGAENIDDGRNSLEKEGAHDILCRYDICFKARSLLPFYSVFIRWTEICYPWLLRTPEAK